MKFLSTFTAAGLALLTCVPSFVSASAAVDLSRCKSFVQAHRALALSDDLVAARSVSPAKQEAGYINGTIEIVAQLVSEMLSVMLVGGATDKTQLDYLCKTADPTRLQNQFYNITLMRNILCSAAAQPEITPLTLIRNVTTEIETEIWIIQTMGAVQGVGNIQKLCDMIDPVAASAIGLAGPYVKANVCAAAKVAKAVEKSGGTKAYTMTEPTITNIAPLSEVTLEWQRVTPTPTTTPNVA